MLSFIMPSPKNKAVEKEEETRNSLDAPNSKYKLFEPTGSSSGQ